MKKIYFIMALGLATLSGCSDFLDQNNKSNVPSAEFYQTSAGFASLTNSAYSTLRELYNAQPQLFVAVGHYKALAVWSKRCESFI